MFGNSVSLRQVVQAVLPHMQNDCLCLQATAKFCSHFLLVCYFLCSTISVNLMGLCEHLKQSKTKPVYTHCAVLHAVICQYSLCVRFNLAVFAAGCSIIVRDSTKVWYRQRYQVILQGTGPHNVTPWDGKR